GAGLSTNAGIPDFRSKGGIYSRLAEYKLDSPEDMFHIETFRTNPKPFYSFAKTLLSNTSWKPTLAHKFIKLLEEKGKLLRNYTQNIDGIEQACGIVNVFQCHGSFATASCTVCKFKTTFEDIRSHLEAGNVMECPKCFQKRDGIIKPDIVFFGEKVPPKFDRLLSADLKKVDLFIVMGSSLKIAPVSTVLGQLPPYVETVLINKEALDPNLLFGSVILGDCDETVQSICSILEWELAT
ncbi:DHS-like NAD/FAD-binding domain-containing protein, partial [Obelidium mucronatum]